MTERNELAAADEIAVIGMAGRFPGAGDIEHFWENLIRGVESITFFANDELEVSAAERERLDDPRYVKAGGILEGADLFDASFFGINPRRAEILDPQQRLFLECAWAVIESAGYVPERYNGAIGVIAGCGANSYYLANLLSNRAVIADAGNLQTMLGNDRNFLTTFVSYKLGLTGPSITVQTACSTSLVAVHLACQSLLSGECDMALAGGVTINVPQKSGYLYQEGGIPSPDGHCRAFDADAQGTVFGSGVGVVLLKRLEEALDDGDTVRAVIKGSAVDNDGAVKVGYTAPGVEGQSRVISEALAMADVDPATITYIEAHGTGTSLGDPIEVAALTRVFRTYTDEKRYCALGAVKTNIGHLDTAAGVAGLIKAVLALEHRSIPPTVHFKRPNPEIDFADSPFFVNAEPLEWRSKNGPRRAGVSSFGLGGTNAHAVLEEAPRRRGSETARSRHLLLLSARSEAALDRMTDNLADYLVAHPDLSGADVAFTAQVGRREMPYRRSLVYGGLSEAETILRTRDSKRMNEAFYDGRPSETAFLFPGQGAQYPGMGADLYRELPRFHEEVDRCSELAAGRLGFDLREVLYPEPGAEKAAERRLTETAVTQPALFVVEYALARWLMGVGIRPAAMIGHSIGEYVAAALAGVFTVEDALALVVERGRLMQLMPHGSMLAVSLSEEELAPFLNDRCSLAAANQVDSCVVSGEHAAIESLEAALAERDVQCRRLRTSHAFHSDMMDPIIEPFIEAVRGTSMSAPAVPYISNTSGTWITEEQAVDPRYYANHLRRGVRFADGVRELLERPSTILLEVGPGHTLSTLTRRHPRTDSAHLIASTIRHPREHHHDTAFLLGTLGRLWCSGTAIDWTELHRGERRIRVPLPTYPFERRRYWVEPGTSAPRPSRRRSETGSAEDWFYVPVWRRTDLPLYRLGAGNESGGLRCLIFVDDCGVGKRLAKRLEREGNEVYTVLAGNEFSTVDDRICTLNPGDADGYRRLVEELDRTGNFPNRIVHLWNVSADGERPAGDAALQRDEERGFYSLLSLSKALGAGSDRDRCELIVVADGLFGISGAENVQPGKSLVLGPCMVVPLEFPELPCRAVDIVPSPPGSWRDERLIDHLASEVTAPSRDFAVAYRGDERWARDFEQIALEEGAQRSLPLRGGGVYLVTGGLGGMGLELASSIGAAVRATIVLCDLAEIPERGAWDGWLASRGDEGPVGRAIGAIRSIERSGSTVAVMRADVTDTEGMKRLVSTITERYGGVNGVVHAAGVPGGGVIPLKTREAAARVLGPKVRGTVALDAALAGNPLDFFVICSSLNSVFGVVGQVDYCAANAFQDAFARYRSVRDGGFTLAINWDRWNEVGMAVGASAPGSFDVVRRGTAVTESTQPLLDERIEESDGREVYVTRFAPERHWVLDEHRIGGNPVIPGTAYLEIAREMFARHAGEGPVELNNVTFVNPLVVGDGRSREVTSVLTRTEGGYDFAVASGGYSDASTPVEHATGTVRSIQREETPRRRIDEIERRCTGEARFDASGGEGDGGSAIVRFGPRWHTVRRIKTGENEAIALLELADEYEEDLQRYLIHPALLDMATGFASRFAGGGGFVPFWYGSVTIWKPLTKRIFSYVTFERNDAVRETVSFDIVITDERGEELVAIDQFVMKRVAGYDIFDDTEEPATHRSMESTAGSGAGGGTGVRGSDELPETPATAEGESGTGGAGIPRRRGLSSEEGVAVFERALRSGVHPQLLVSTVDLNESIEQARSFTRDRVDEERGAVGKSRELHPRSGVGGEYVAPRTERERALAEVWEELFGIEQVGIRDNFFDLGGDSVLGLRIVVGANKKGIKLQPQQLFEYQTIEELAAATEGGEVAEPSTPARKVADRPVQPAGDRDTEPVRPATLSAPDDDTSGDGSTAGETIHPSDFPDADISQEDLDTIMNAIDRPKRRDHR